MKYFSSWQDTDTGHIYFIEYDVVTGFEKSLRSNDQSKCLHRQLWEWLARNPDMTIGQWPGWRAMLERGESWPVNMSFACEVAMRTCPICPVDWGKKGYRCFDQGALLDEWDKARSDLRPFYAWQIRDGWKR